MKLARKGSEAGRQIKARKGDSNEICQGLNSWKDHSGIRIIIKPREVVTGS